MVQISVGGLSAVVARVLVMGLLLGLCVARASGQPAHRGDQAVLTGFISTHDPLVEVIAKVRPSVVAVGSYHFKDRPSVRYFGTGFVVHDGLTVVTNAHVVDAVRKTEREPQLRIFFPDTKAVEGRPATVLVEDTFHDVAVLRFEGPPAPVLTLNLKDEPPQGHPVAVLGYPIGLKLGLVPAAHRGIVAAVVPAVLPLPTGVRMTPELAEAIRRPYNLYQLDMVVFPGNSGSPLLDGRDGRVVGIINKALATKTREHMLTEPSGISYAVPTRWINELIVRSIASLPSSPEPVATGLPPIGD